MHAAALRAADLLLPSTPVIVLGESLLQRSHKHGQMLALPFRAPHVRSTAPAVSSPDRPAGRRAAAVLPGGACLKNGACVKASSGRARSREQQKGVCWSWVSGSPQLRAEPWMHWAAPLGDAGLFQSHKLPSFVLCQVWQRCLSCTVPGRMFLCGGREHLGSSPRVPAGPQRAYRLVAKLCWQAAIATNKSRMFVV